MTSIDTTTTTMPHNPKHHPTTTLPTELSWIFIFIVLTICSLTLWHILYTYFLRSRPQFYSIPDPRNPLLHDLHRITPFREWLRKSLGRPRSGSDVMRDEEFERVRAGLAVRGWRGRVASDGTPDRQWARDWDVGYPGDEEAQSAYGPRQYVEREDSVFWQSGRGRNGRRYDTFSQTRPVARTIPSHSSSSVHEPPPLNPHLLGTPSPGTALGVTPNAAYSYQVSPRGTNFVTPPARASRNILGLPVQTVSEDVEVEDLTFPHEELTRHYANLCWVEDSARKSGTAEEVVEASRKRKEFGDRFSIEANARGKRSGLGHGRGRKESPAPPPYSEVASSPERGLFEGDDEV